MDDVFAVLSDVRRREILKQLAGGEQSASDVHRAHGEVTFGAISQHLKVLQRAGLVTLRQAGRNRFYQANIEALLPLRQWLDWMWDHSLDRLKQLTEAEAMASAVKNPDKDSRNAKPSSRRITRAGKVPRRARSGDRGAS
jgi:DNA-binding transcriptional ArsR family regulator